MKLTSWALSPLFFPHTQKNLGVFHVHWCDKMQLRMELLVYYTLVSLRHSQQCRCFVKWRAAVEALPYICFFLAEWSSLKFCAPLSPSSLLNTRGKKKEGRKEEEEERKKEKEGRKEKGRKRGWFPSIAYFCFHMNTKKTWCDSRLKMNVKPISGDINKQYGQIHSTQHFYYTILN